MGVEADGQGAFAARKNGEGFHGVAPDAMILYAAIDQPLLGSVDSLDGLVATEDDGATHYFFAGDTALNISGSIRMDFDEKVRAVRSSPRGLEIGSVKGHFLESNFSQGSFEECHSNKFPHQVFVRTFSSVSDGKVTQ